MRAFLFVLAAISRIDSDAMRRKGGAEKGESALRGDYECVFAVSDAVFAQPLSIRRP